MTYNILTPIANNQSNTVVKTTLVSLIESYNPGGATGNNVPATWGDTRQKINDIAFKSGNPQIADKENSLSASIKVNTLIDIETALGANYNSWYANNGVKTLLGYDGVNSANGTTGEVNTNPAFIADFRNDRYAIAKGSVNTIINDSSSNVSVLTTASLSDVITISRTGDSTIVNSNGSIQTVANNTTRFDYTNNRIVHNLVYNSSNIGAVVGPIGSGGAYPTQYLIGGITGINKAVTATGTTDGIPWTEIRVYGTNTSGVVGYLDPYPKFIVNSGQTVAAPACYTGQIFTYSLWASLQAGSWPVATSAGSLYHAYLNEAGAYVAGGTQGPTISTWKRYTLTQTVPATAGIYRIRGYISMAIGIGETVDFTYRFGGVMLEESPVASDYVVQTTLGNPINLQPQVVKNIAKYSEVFQDATWVKDSGVSVTVNQLTAPDGTLTGDKITFTATGSKGIYQTATLTANLYTYSVYAATTSGTNTFRFKYNNGSTNKFSKDFTANTTWQRFSFTTLGAAAAGNFGIQNGSSATAGDIYLWGFQAEQSHVMGSYSPTSSANTYIKDTLNPIKKQLLVEPTSTNLCLNSVFSGYVAGTPGTIPANSLTAVASWDGMSRSVYSTGTEYGMNYVDIRYNGTTIASPTGPAQIILSNLLSVTAGDNYTTSIYLRLVGGSLKNIAAFDLRNRWQYANGVVISDSTSSSLLQTSSTLKRAVVTGVAPAGVANLNPFLRIQHNGSSAIDYIIRFYAPQVEKLDSVTSWIPTGANTATRSAEFVNLTTKPVKIFNRANLGVAIKGQLTRPGVTASDVSTLLTTSTNFNISCRNSTTLRVGTSNGVFDDVVLASTFTNPFGLVVTKNSNTLYSTMNGDSNVASLVATSATTSSSIQIGAGNSAIWYDSISVYPFTLDTNSIVSKSFPV